MMWDVWMKTSYMVQLIAACLIFMIPAVKRKQYRLRTGSSAVCLIVFSYFINYVYNNQDIGIMFFIYWAYYIVACVIFVWIGLDVSWIEAAYCAICACAMQHAAFDVYYICMIWDSSLRRIGGVLAYALIYILLYFLIAKKLPEQGRFTVNKRALFPIATIILLVWLLSVLDIARLPGFESGNYQKIMYRVIDALCCFYILWMQVSQKENISLQREIDGINYAWRQQTSQYQVTKDTIENINLKCHDLKHQIRALRQIPDKAEREAFLNEIENDIMIYDTALRTGNAALDTVLMEKGLYCKNHDIQWSCMADGSKLDMMKLEDIYALFGNALNNAIAAVMKLTDPDQRIISVKIVTRKNLVMIQIQNYYDMSLYFKQGLPMTTKKNKNDHGYGMKSIRNTAEKYGGTMTVKAENNIFRLQVLIPV